MNFLRDLWWLRRARRLAVGRIDGLRMGDRPGVPDIEIIAPRWWQLRRWLAWLRAPLRKELTLGRRGGGFVFLVMRCRRAPSTKPLPIRLPSGKVISPR